jgi:hypothetical protein
MIPTSSFAGRRQVLDAAPAVHLGAANVRHLRHFIASCVAFAIAGLNASGAEDWRFHTSRFGRGPQCPGNRDGERGQVVRDFRSEYFVTGYSVTVTNFLTTTEGSPA